MNIESKQYTPLTFADLRPGLECVYVLVTMKDSIEVARIRITEISRTDGGDYYTKYVDMDDSTNYAWMGFCTDMGVPHPDSAFHNLHRVIPIEAWDDAKTLEGHSIEQFTSYLRLIGSDLDAQKTWETDQQRDSIFDYYYYIEDDYIEDDYPDDENEFS